MYECFAYMYVCVPHVFLVPSEASKELVSPETGVTGGGELPHVDAGNLTQVFWKNGECSRLLSHLLGPRLFHETAFHYVSLTILELAT